MKEWIKIQIKYWLPVYLYLGFIFYLSSLSNIPMIESHVISGLVISSYIKHSLEYFILGILLIRAFEKSRIKNPYLFSLTVLIVYALSDEIHQLFVSGREFDLIDWIFDSLGGGLGVLTAGKDLYRNIVLKNI